MGALITEEQIFANSPVRIKISAHIVDRFSHHRLLVWWQHA